LQHQRPRRDARGPQFLRQSHDDPLLGGCARDITVALASVVPRGRSGTTSGTEK
jgi:hypothetical protein